MRNLLIACGSGLLLAAGAPAAPTELRFGSEPWHLALSLGGLKPTQGVESTADRQAWTYSNDKGTILSVIVENAHAPADKASCRDVFERRKADLKPANEVQGERGDAATQEYDFQLDFRGKAIVQHNIFSCRVRGTWYIDAHVSKIGYDAARDRAALLALLDGVAIVE
ncbi:MAG TPA: hypothetical protein VF079_06185 [Sphingomicrobium sp.]